MDQAEPDISLFKLIFIPCQNITHCATYDFTQLPMTGDGKGFIQLIFPSFPLTLSVFPIYQNVYFLAHNMKCVILVILLCDV